MSWFQWLGTQNGRIFLQGLALTSTFTGMAITHLPQTVYIDKYKEFVQSYQHGMEQKVPKNAKKLFEETIKESGLEEAEKSLIKAFTVYGFDLFHAGSTTVWSGAIIGLPINFSYESTKDVNRQITVGLNKIDWESEAGKKLLDSLVLSEKARKFGIAREIASVNNSSIWFYDAYAGSAIIGTYMTARTLNERFRLNKHPFRFIMYSLIALFSTALYFTLTDITTIKNESIADETAAKISPEYTEGGIEFYQKIQKRNQALRELMGSIGEKVYTVTGNDVAFLRMKTTPLSERLLALKEISKKAVEDDK